MVRRSNRRSRIARGRTTRTTRTRRSARSARPRTRTTTRNPRTTNRRRTANFKPWTPSDVKQLRKMYRDTPNKEVAKKLGRSISAVQGKAGDLGLKKTQSYLRKMRQGWR